MLLRGAGGTQSTLEGTSGKAHFILYYWNTSSLSYEVATVPSPSGASDATAANQTTEIARLTSIESGVATHRMKVLAAVDLHCARTWYDEGTSSRRPNAFTYSSASIGGASHTRTFTWRLSGGTYVLDEDEWS